MNISVIGDSLVDITIPLSNTDQPPAFGKDLISNGEIICSPGGSGCNTTAHISSLLSSKYNLTLYTGFSSSESDIWRSTLIKQGEKAKFTLKNIALEDNYSTGSCVIFTNEVDHGFVTHQGAVGKLSLNHFNPFYSELSQSFHIHICGIFSMSLLRDNLLGLIKRIKENGFKGKISLDTNLDSRGIWKGKWMEALNEIDILFTNETEGKEISGFENRKEIIKFFLKKYEVKLLVLKIGKDGVLAGYWKDKEIKFVQRVTKEVKVIDQCGAGDAFCAGFLFKWIEKGDLESCLDYGNAAGGFVVSHYGAATELLSPEVFHQVKE
eukprot:maker-scaffold_25-snap-gene-0.42-mRNA-1 protein AED:0.03 eAED:0.03 QI:292/1/1/1/0.5/0.33/3/301/322